MGYGKIFQLRQKHNADLDSETTYYTIQNYYLINENEKQNLFSKNQTIIDDISKKTRKKYDFSILLKYTDLLKNFITYNITSLDYNFVPALIAINYFLRKCYMGNMIEYHYLMRIFLSYIEGTCIETFALGYFISRLYNDFKIETTLKTLLVIEKIYSGACVLMSQNKGKKSRE
jgi:hypothetical protein